MAYSKMRESSQYRTVLRTTAADLRHARQMAVSSGQPVAYKILLQQRKLGIEGRPPQGLPESIQVRATVAQQAMQSGAASIVFMPSGGSTGGSIEVIRSNGEGSRLRVDWFSGQVTQERLLP